MNYSPQLPSLPTALRQAKRFWTGLRHAFGSVLLGVTLGALLGGVFSPAKAAQNRFMLVSPTVHSGTAMPAINVAGHGNCSGGNQSPPLAWSHAPQGTASFAISMADLDAKVGVVWLWLMFNIDPTVTSLAQNAAGDPHLLPSGAAQARNGFDTVGYLGPCPKKGGIPHHYLITVWALDQAHLPFKDGVGAEAVAIYLRHHALGHANLTPHYGVR